MSAENAAKINGPSGPRSCSHGQVTGTAGVIRCPHCRMAVADNGVRVTMRLSSPLNNEGGRNDRR